jgi:glycosyltransferase involved in cell wall biosynthesis
MNNAENARRPLVSVVMPAFNEENGLERNLTRLSEYLKTISAEYRSEIIIVNDGSSDRTGDIADTFAAGREDVVALHQMFNFRLGQALRVGFQRSRGEIVVVLDADLSYAPEHMGTMLTRMRETRAKIIIASPYRKGGRLTNVPFLRRVLSRLANRFLCLMATKDFFSDRLTNITGMVRAYDGEFIRGLSLWAMDVDINPEIISKAKMLHARIVEVPAHLDWSASKADRGGGRRGPSARRLARTVIQSLVMGFLFRPFLFFIFPGLLLFVLSLYPLTWTIIHTLRTYAQMMASGVSIDYRLSEAIGAAFKIAPHAFIVGGIALLVSIQLISLGLLALQKKRYFVELFYLSSLILHNCRIGSDDRISMTDPLRRL